MPTLFLMCGLPGSGKTTFAKRLEAERFALRLCPDDWIEKFIADSSDKAELDRLRDLVEELQWKIAQRALSLGINVILENGFWSREERDRLHVQGKQLGARVELHFFDVPLEELARRLETRNQNLPTGTFKVSRTELKLWSTWFEPPSSGEMSQYDSHSRAS